MLIGKGKSELAGWERKEGKFWCRIPYCQERGVSFAHKFALGRHWHDVHEPDIKSYPCTVEEPCRTFK